MEKKKLSVIVPIYNVEKYLEKCVSSILQQTYTNLEIILVDDGSTDSSALICDEFVRGDDRVRVVHKHNGGLISARSAGVDMATAEYIAFVDGDDWIAPNMYEELMQIMSEHNLDMVTSGWIMSWQEGYAKTYEDSLLEEGIYNRQRMEECILPRMLWDFYEKGFSLSSSVCCKIFRKELLIEQYAELRRQDFFYGEDAAVTYPYLLSAQKIYISHNKYYYYRQKEKGSYSACFSSDDYFSELFSLYCYLRKCFERSVYKDVLIKQLDYFYMSCVQKRRWGYKDKRGEDVEQFLFPFEKIEKGSKIVLYGAGEVGHQYKRQIIHTGYCILAGWVDLNYEKYIGENVKPIAEAAKMEFDHIVIANAELYTCIQIKKTLIDMGIDEEKIIWRRTNHACLKWGIR